MARVYDPIGIVAPVTSVRKEIYHEILWQKTFLGWRIAIRSQEKMKKMDEQPNKWDQYNSKSGEKCEESFEKFTRSKRLWLAWQCSDMK